MLTYARMEYAKRTVDALLANFVADGEDVWVHVADDGSSQEYRDELLTFVRARFGALTSITNSERHGYGASYNLATQHVHRMKPTDGIRTLVLPLEDDWELAAPLDIGVIADVLRRDVFGCVRMGYIGFTQPLHAVFESHEDDYWLRLDPDSEEPHVWAGHPRLETVEFQRAVGPWPEGMDAGSTEFEVSNRPEARRGVGWPIGLIPPRGGVWQHIGTVQARSDQREGS